VVGDLPMTRPGCVPSTVSMAFGRIRSMRSETKVDVIALEVPRQLG